ncbi:uncharacterized protein BXZ73DRAFT_87558 [Epithele typhae]|uniref:uncharacterized protein n=1 Tax=Epithele typhae TaxID=378194 RepID=UPI002008DF2A|nr:uncharacterized protein BXZ73DRAFT_87558 [Epithele typhae]KAH9943165.1 hypothetical protein BXZ73DRAFT_87558 [Epithele typhae]
MAASAADVRSILSIPSAAASGSTPAPKKTQASERTRKPEGIPRELYALIGPSAPTLAAQFAKPQLKQKPNLGGGRKVKWEWRPFKNGARSDELRLSHWVKSSEDPETEYHFAKYNISTPSYYLEDPDWTKEETDYLFGLMREYDGRFFVVHDRYESPNRKERTIEDIKDRYFSVCRKLVRNRAWLGDEHSKAALIASLSYDKHRENTRKRYVKSLENRTPEQIAEEDALYLELEKLKENERRFKKDRDELLRTLCGIESGLPDIREDDEALLGPLNEVKKKKKGVSSSVEPQTPVTPASATVIALPQPQPKKSTAKSAAYDALHCIVRTDTDHPTTKAAHQPAHLRSYKIAQPKQGAQSRVPQLLGELGVTTGRLVMPTRDNLAKYAALVDAAQQLIELKKAVDKQEQDIRVSQARLATLRGEDAGGDSKEVPQTPMEIDNGADGEAEAEGEGESNRAQSVGRRSMSISSVDTAGGSVKRQKQR